jgi:hypothetical protein
MNKPKNCIPPALKHGIYSGMTLLPSEDPAEFEKFRQEIIAEYNPVGRSEEDIVENLCRLMWRRQNLSIYRLAEWAKAERQRIREKFIPSDWEGLVEALGPERSPEERDALRKKRRKADEEAQTELGTVWQLVQVGDVATTDHLLKELSIIERVEYMIERALKRLMFVRGVKSISRPPDTASPPLRLVNAVTVPTT